MNTTQLLPVVTEPAMQRLLALADDELVLGHRHSEWLGLSPFLEEDLTMASIAQDELGHARAIYALVWPELRDRDTLVMRREPHFYRSCNLVERAGAPWEFALVRHWLYDAGEDLRWEALAGCPVLGLSGVAAAAREEERFHRKHAQELVVRLCTGSSDGRNRIQHSLDDLWCDALAMLHDEPELVAPFAESVSVVAAAARLSVPEVSRARSDRAIRHADFGGVHRAFIEVFEIDPEATW